MNLTQKAILPDPVGVEKAGFQQLRTMRLIWLLFAALLVSASISRGGFFADEADLALSRFRATNFSCVVLVGALQSNIWNALGSAVAIPSPKVPNGSEWFVCSGHQMTTASFDGLRVTVKDPVDNHVIERGYVDRAFVHPQWAGTTGAGVDLALLHVTNAITSLTPTVIHTNPLPAVGLMHQCGYGVFGTAGNGPGVFDGAKRAGCNIMGDVSSIWIERQYLMCAFDRPNRPDFQQGEWQGSGYDSGGGAFVYTNGQMEFAATLSFAGPSGNWDFGSVSGVIPVGPYLDWINATIAAVEQPSLKLQQLDSATLKLRWPSAASEFVLQTQGTLTTTNWTDAGLTANDDGTNWSVIVTNTGPSRFWRLAKQPGPASAGLTIHGPASVLRPAAKLTADPMWDDLLPHVPVPER